MKSPFLMANSHKVSLVSLETQPLPEEQNEDVSEVERRGAARGLAEVLLARRDLLPGGTIKR